MNLVIIALCLLSERFLVHSIAVQRFRWFPDYVNTLCRKLSISDSENSDYLISALVILPIVLLVSLIVYCTRLLLFGFLEFFIRLALFYYCLGPNNVFFPLTSLDKADVKDGQSPVNYYFSRINAQLFAVIFWFIITGPIGLVLYRLLSLCAENPRTRRAISPLLMYVDWTTARITALFYLLAGNFQQGLSLYTKLFLTSPVNNSVMLSSSGNLAARSDKDSEVSLITAQVLVEHALILFVVLIALLTIIAWL